MPKRILPELHDSFGREEIKRAVFEALGAASVCWDSPGFPEGEFSSDTAEQVGNELLEIIDRYREADWMADISGAAEIGGSKSEKDREEKDLPYSIELHRLFKAEIHKYAMHLDILRTDVTFGHFHQGNQMAQGYMLILVCRGALLGHQNILTNQSIIVGHVPPTELEIKNILVSACTQLREAKAQQGGQNGLPLAWQEFMTNLTGHN